MPLAITVILEHESEITRIASHEYPRLLFIDDTSLAHLSTLDDCSYDIFASSDMPQLIRELSTVRSGLSADDVPHIDKIIDLCERCSGLPGSTLAFTPFETV